MVRFYFSLLRDIPRVLRSTHEAWAYWIFTAGLPLVLWLWPELRPMTQSPWLIVVPVALSVIYGMLRVNYVRFIEKDTAVRDLKNKLDATCPSFDLVESQLKDAALDPSMGLVPLHHRLMIALAFKIDPTRRSASDIAGWFVFVRGTLTEPPLIAGPLDSGYDEHRTLDVKQWLPTSVSAPNTPPCFIAMEIRSLDAQTGLRGRQRWYLKWNGVNAGGVFYDDFADLSRTDTDRFIEYLNRQIPGGWSP